jgi:hypothetical protein
VQVGTADAAPRTDEHVIIPVPEPDVLEADVLLVIEASCRTVRTFRSVDSATVRPSPALAVHEAATRIDPLKTYCQVWVRPRNTVALSAWTMRQEPKGSRRMTPPPSRLVPPSTTAVMPQRVADTLRRIADAKLGQEDDRAVAGEDDAHSRGTVRLTRPHPPG